MSLRDWTDKRRGLVKVEMCRLKAGNVVWVDPEGLVHDLGSMTLEEWKLLATLTDRAVHRQKSLKMSIGALTRLKSRTLSMYHKAKAPTL